MSIENDYKPWIITAEKLQYSANILKMQILKSFPTLEEASVDKNTIEALRNEGIDISRGALMIAANISAYMLLLGYSLENIIKGALMKKHYDENDLHFFEDFYEMQKSVWGNTNGHDLTKLINKIESFELYKAERTLITRLEHYIRWAGRYEYSKKNDQYKPEIIAAIKIMNSDSELFNQLKFRLTRKVGIEISSFVINGL